MPKTVDLTQGDIELLEQAQVLSVQIDDMVSGQNMGVAMMALCAVMGRAISIIGTDAADRKELLDTAISEINNSTKHWLQHPPAPAKKDLH